MKEINNFQQESDENLYQAWEQFKELLMKCPQHYLMEMQDVIMFYNGLGIPTQEILDSRGTIPSKNAADEKVAVQEMIEYSRKWHNVTSRSKSTETSNRLAAIQAQLNNLGRDIKKVNEKVYTAQVGYQSALDPQKTILSTARAKIDVYKRKITLRVGEERIISTSVKPASSLIKRVYMLSLRERMELDLEARRMRETLVLNRSLDPFFEDYIELNDLNEPFELRRNQGDDLMPTIKEGDVIEQFRTRDDELNTKIDDYSRPRERNMDEYWWRTYKSEDLEVLES
ncbi:hypothetical protein Tco_1163903 [Tanacetum coccineum]